MSELKICGRCKRHIEEDIWLVEVGYGAVHITCYKGKTNKNY